MSQFDEGGCYSFFATFRPVHGISSETIRRICKYAHTSCAYWFIVAEKEAHEKHVHAVLFPKKSQQRSNIITNLTRHCISDWTDAEQKNFRRWDKVTKTGAVKVVTHLEVITDYLDGTRVKKCNDPFEIVDQFLPDDLAVLEKYIPNVGALARKKNIWCHTWHKAFIDVFGWPHEKGLHVEENYVLCCVKHCENIDKFEICVDTRIKKNKVRAFAQWWNSDCYDTYGDNNWHSDLFDRRLNGKIENLMWPT